jgi:hypothetical protein
VPAQRSSCHEEAESSGSASVRPLIATPRGIFSQALHRRIDRRPPRIEWPTTSWERMEGDPSMNDDVSVGAVTKLEFSGYPAGRFLTLRLPSKLTEIP